MSDLDERRALVATACRVLAHRGLAPGVLGHVSLRVGEDRALVRCRGPRERGLAWTTPDDVRTVTLEGELLDGADEGYAVPNELPLHTEVLRARPDVDAVVHAHPSDTVAADLAGLVLRPIVGAFDIPGAHLAAGGVPVYPRAVLVRNRELAGAMVAALGDRPVVLLRGHGLTATGRSVEQAVLRARSVDTLAAMTLAVARAGGIPRELPPEDLAELPDLGGGFTLDTAWRHEVASLPPGS
ncbi:class II aldolase/adducin family protein [Actinomycetospora lutea]|uniref:class II aldolase/adducin family protein n=1 Tax=Actinomycetospora lutea TaxID=663604 RepID=UPI00236685DF|nr:class II aldolase/adducin family protein [Actinomycetospora lutea]MDD7939189.1 class II aldolase/adducin family protein [Actinomycetospora lutea]